jgi:hypothetical protein
MERNEYNKMRKYEDFREKSIKKYIKKAIKTKKKP